MHTINSIPIGENSYQNKNREYSVDVTFYERVLEKHTGLHICCMGSLSTRRGTIDREMTFLFGELTHVKLKNIFIYMVIAFMGYYA